MIKLDYLSNCSKTQRFRMIIWYFISWNVTSTNETFNRRMRIETYKWVQSCIQFEQFSFPRSSKQYEKKWKLRSILFSRKLSLSIFNLVQRPNKYHPYNRIWEKGFKLHIILKLPWILRPLTKLINFLRRYNFFTSGTLSHLNESSTEVYKKYQLTKTW